MARYRLRRKPVKPVYRIEGRFCIVESPVKAVFPREACEHMEYLLSGRQRHLLLLGPPGTGKSLFLKLLVEAYPWSVHVVEPESLFSPYLGETEARFERILAAAESNPPSLLIIDEADRVIERRGASALRDAYAEVSENLVRKLLRRMQRWSEEGSVSLVAASNKPLSEIDPALVRASRFTVVYFPVPDAEAVKLLYKMFGREPPGDDAIYDILTRAPSFDNIVTYIRTGRLPEFQVSPFIKVLALKRLRCQDVNMRHFIVAEPHPVSAVVAALHSMSVYGKPLLLLLDPERYEDAVWLSKSLGWPVAIPHSPFIENKVYSIVYRAWGVYLLGTEWRASLPTLTAQGLQSLCRVGDYRTRLGCSGITFEECLRELALRLASGQARA